VQKEEKERSNIKEMKQREKFSPLSMLFTWKIQGVYYFVLVGEDFSNTLTLVSMV